MALAINVMGFFGGLVMSAIKRDRGVKDWGHMIEGHGGMLDRLDSVVFAAPIFFHLTRYWWALTATKRADHKPLRGCSVARVCRIDSLRLADALIRAFKSRARVTVTE